MDIEQTADVIIFLIMLTGVIGLGCIIRTLIGARRHPGGSRLQARPSSSASDQDSSRKEYLTVDGPFGDRIHFDGNGHYAGRSVPAGANGSMIHFDAEGHFAGRSDPGLFNGQVYHTDASGRYAGQSNPGLFGATVHTGQNGETGVTTDGAFGGKATEIGQKD